MHRVFLPLLLALTLVLPVAARADEIFVLEDGEVLRGWVVRENDEAVVVRLAGFIGEARVTIPRRRVVRRWEYEARTPTYVSAEPEGRATLTARVAEEEPWDAVEPDRPDAEVLLPEAEPVLHAEGFFQRLARVVVMAVPDTPGERMALAILLLIAMMVLLAIGGRIAEIDAMGLWPAVTLALLLEAILVVNVYAYDDLLRADRAILILPLQGLVWLGAAMGLLRVGFARTVLLFAFVLFSLAVLVFSAGAILVSF